MGKTLRARVELLLGIHASSYDLYVGKRQLSISGDCYASEEGNSDILKVFDYTYGHGDKNKEIIDCNSTKNDNDDELRQRNDCHQTVADELQCMTSECELNEPVSTGTRGGEVIREQKLHINLQCLDTPEILDAKNQPNISDQRRVNGLENLRSGTLMKIVPRSDWEEAFDVGLGRCYGENLNLFVEKTKKATAAGSSEDKEDHARKGIAALFLASHQGRTEIVRRLWQGIFEGERFCAC